MAQSTYTQTVQSANFLQPVYSFTGGAGNQLLSINDSGKLFLLQGAGGNVFLPSSTGAYGANYTFVTAGSVSTAFQISPTGGGTVSGTVVSSQTGAGASGKNYSAAAAVTIGTGSTIGDQAKFVSVGSVYTVQGTASLAATFS